MPNLYHVTTHLSLQSQKLGESPRDPFQTQFENHCWKPCPSWIYPSLVCFLVEQVYYSMNEIKQTAHKMNNLVIFDTYIHLQNWYHHQENVHIHHTRVSSCPLVISLLSLSAHPLFPSPATIVWLFTVKLSTIK